MYSAIRINLLYCHWNIPPPQGTQEGITNTTYLDELTDLLTEVTAKHRNIIILGDFNMHIENSEDPDAQVLIDTLEAFSLKQHIPFPTYNQGHILDLITTENNTCLVMESASGPYISEHQMVYINLNFRKKNRSTPNRNFAN